MLWCSWNNWCLTASILGGCGHLDRTNFQQFWLLADVVVLKELIFNKFYIRKVWWSWKNWFLTLSIFRGHSGLDRTDFEQFLYWEGVVVLTELIFSSFDLADVVVLKELIFNKFYIRKVWWSWKNWFLTVSILGGCGGIERTDFEQCGIWDAMVVLKELIFNSFYFGRVWWYWKDWFWTVCHLGCCVCPE